MLKHPHDTCDVEGLHMPAVPTNPKTSFFARHLHNKLRAPRLKMPEDPKDIGFRV